MNAQQFAKEWGNYRFRLPEEAMPSAMVIKHDGYLPRFKLIGFITDDDEKVVVELDDDNKQYGWPAHNVTLTVDREELNTPNFPIVMAVSYKLLNPPRTSRPTAEEMKRKEADALALAAASRVSPYPHICETCSAPARKSGGHILCSNPTCKTRGKLLKSINYKPVKRGKTIPIYCPKCQNIKGRAVYLSGPDDGIYYFECDQGHDFTLPAEQLVKNNVVFATLFGYDNDRLWNGESWENI